MVVQPRYRIVTFRLSLQEYEIALAGCEAQGAHSMSEYARCAVLERARQFLNGSDSDLAYKDASQESLRDRIEALIDALRRAAPSPVQENN